MIYKRFFLILLIVVIIVVGNIFIAKSFLSSIYFRIFYPIISPLNQKVMAIANYSHNILYASDLADQINSLKRSNDELLSKVGRLNELEDENQLLRTRLNLAADTTHQLIFAAIFNVRGEDSVSSFMINKGSGDGIKNGLAVVTAEGVLAGVVSNTLSHSALVSMPQNKNLSLNVKVSGTDILAKSEGDNKQAILNYVTSQEEIKPDDLVVTSGLDNIPEAIPVFKVIESHLTEGGLFRSVTVTPIFEILNTSKVFVIN